ncbi:hypothetical protein D3C86_1493210 [compost metagenome]
MDRAAIWPTPLAAEMSSLPRVIPPWRWVARFRAERVFLVGEATGEARVSTSLTAAWALSLSFWSPLARITTSATKARGARAGGAFSSTALVAAAAPKASPLATAVMPATTVAPFAMPVLSVSLVVTFSPMALAASVTAPTESPEAAAEATLTWAPTTELTSLSALVAAFLIRSDSVWSSLGCASSPCSWPAASDASSWGRLRSQCG